MGRCDQVQVVAAFLLQVEHHIRQSLWADAVTQSSLAQRKILAICAASLAVAKENCAGPARAAYRRLLAAVNIPRGDNGLRTRTAHARLPRNPITAAVLWADSATAQDLPRSLCTLRQFARLIKLKVAGIKHASNPQFGWYPPLFDHDGHALIGSLFFLSVAPAAYCPAEAWPGPQRANLLYVHAARSPLHHHQQ